MVPFCCVRRSGWRLLDGFCADREGSLTHYSRNLRVLNDACSYVRSAIVRCGFSCWRTDRNELFFPFPDRLRWPHTTSAPLLSPELGIA